MLAERVFFLLNAAFTVSVIDYFHVYTLRHLLQCYQNGCVLYMVIVLGMVAYEFFQRQLVIIHALWYRLGKSEVYSKTYHEGPEGGVEP